MIPQKLKLNKDFKPCQVDDNDEIYPNGFFKFNISKMTDYISKNKDEFKLESIQTSFYKKFITVGLDEKTVLKADITKPVILAEISPSKFNVIDGNHRVEKACRDGKKEIMAYVLTVNQHLLFLTSVEAYKTYVEYWNEKVTEILKYKHPSV